MARIFVGMVLSFSLSHTLSTHYMGRRFLYSDSTRLHTWALSNVLKHMYKTKTNSKEGGGGKYPFSPSEETGDGSTSLHVLDNAQSPLYT